MIQKQHALGILGAVLFALGVIYAGVSVYADQKVNQTLETLKTKLPPDVEFSYKTADAGTLSGTLTLDRVRVTKQTGTQTVMYKADQIEISGLESNKDEITRIGSVVAKKGRITSKENPETLTFGGLKIRDLDVAAVRNQNVENAFEGLTLTDATVDGVDDPRKGHVKRVHIEGWRAGGVDYASVQGLEARLPGAAVNSVLQTSQRQTGRKAGPAPRIIRTGELIIERADVDDLQNLGNDATANDIRNALANDGLEQLEVTDLALLKGGEPVQTVDNMSGHVDTTDQGTVEIKLDSVGHTMFLDRMEDSSASLKSLMDQDKLVGDSEMVVSYAPDEGRLAVDELSVSYENVFDISWHLGVIGVDESFLKSANTVSPRNPQAVFRQLSLSDAGLRFTDRGIMSQAIEKRAAKMGMTTEAFRDRMVKMARMRLQPMLGKNDADKVAAFLQNDGNLKIEIAPDNPVRFMQIAEMARQPEILRKELNLQVTRE